MSVRPTPEVCWSRVAADAVRGRPAVFLDRDGVLVVDAGYLGEPQGVLPIPGAGQALACARATGFATVLVTNQSGVGRGYYGWSGFEAVQTEIVRRLREEASGAAFDAEFACGLDPTGAKGGHGWRKPAPGMLLAAQNALNLDLARSWIVGDKASDLAAGRAAGLAGGVLVATGSGSGPAERMAAQALRSADYAVMLAPDVGAAVEQVVHRSGTPSPC